MMKEKYLSEGCRKARGIVVSSSVAWAQRATARKYVRTEDRKPPAGDRPPFLAKYFNKLYKAEEDVVVNFLRRLCTGVL